MPKLTPAPTFITEQSWWPQHNSHWRTSLKNISDLKTLVKNTRQAVIEAFNSHLNISACVNGYALAIDHLLWHVWQSQHLQDNEATLIAVGGYGRAELHLQSDIDLMIVISQQISADTESKLSTFLTMLWDSGLEVGHSVRTVDEAFEESKKDITVITCIMESRLICGDPALYDKLKQVLANNQLWSCADFFQAKKQELVDRHAKYGDTLYQLEPNIKEGPGGLRDIQFIDWVTKRYFNNHNLHELVAKGFILEKEYSSLHRIQEYLWSVRFRLALITQRRDERLLFDHQIELARRSGYNDSNANLAVEQFMQNYYRHLSECSQLVTLLSAHFQEHYLNDSQAQSKNTIGNYYYSVGETLHINDADTLFSHPKILLDIFFTLQKNPELTQIGSKSIRLICDNLHLIDNDFRNHTEHKKLFIEILRQPRLIARELKRMHSLGVLAAYWPAFGRIVGHMQYDLYHVYTVDHHILTVLTEARRLGDKERSQDDISAIFHSLPKLEILYLAALFHDVAKGRDGDHSTEGSQESMQFCLDHGLSQFDATLVSWLVENHLIMSITAQHKDLNEPSVIQKFTDQVSNVIRLNYLYLLTIADIKGTNPTLWNNWRSTLLADLYKYTAFQLRAEAPRDNSAIIEDIKSSALTQLEQQGLDQQECQQFWQTHNDDYFLRHTDDEIAWHTHIALNPTNETNTHVHVRVSPQRGSTEIFIYTPDKAHLFAQLTDCLLHHNLSILDARIITSKTSMTFNTFNVTDHLGQVVDCQEQIKIIQNDIERVLASDEIEHNQAKQFVSTRMLHFQVPAEINIKNADHLDHTILHVHAADHPGLLANIAQALAAANVKVIGARISTLGEKVHDIFHITHMDGSKIINTQEQKTLSDYLQAQLTPTDNQHSSYII